MHPLIPAHKELRELRRVYMSLQTGANVGDSDGDCPFARLLRDRIDVLWELIGRLAE